MNLFGLELKKLWNWRAVLLIALLSILVWFAVLSDFLGSYESMTTHGIYGDYQTEMYKRYGTTLEPEELADFDIPGKKEALARKIDVLIQENSIFAEYGIHNAEEYFAFDQMEIPDEAQEEGYFAVRDQMNNILELHEEGQTLDQWYDSPLMRYNSLKNLEIRYVNDRQDLEVLMGAEGDEPVVVKTASNLIESQNTNLIPYFLCDDFSLYAANVGIIMVTAVLFLVSPLLVTDRLQNIHLLQYSSFTGRRVLRVQLAAVMTSAFFLALILCVGAYGMMFSAYIDDYWNARIMNYSGLTMQFYNITFGTYVLLLGEMSVVFCMGAAGAAFVLSRVSANMVSLLIKMVPVCALFALILFYSLNRALSYSWIGPNFFRGKFDLPEIWILLFLSLLGIAAALMLIRRERRAEVL